MKTARNEKGMVLLLVLVVVALLTSLVVEFAFSTLVDLRLTETFRDSTRAWYLAKGGVQAGGAILQMDTNNFDHPSEIWGLGVPSYPVGEEGVISISIEDLNSRLDVNSLVRNRVNPNGALRDAMVRLFADLEIDDPDGIVAAVMDWIDTDDDVTDLNNRAGAEGDYYQLLENPYAIKNGPLDSLDELLLVRGINQEIYSRIAPYLTVYGQKGEKSSQGDSIVNLNTVSPEIMLALDPTMIDLPDVEEIVSFRQNAPFESMNDLKELLGDQNPTYISLSSGTVIQVGVRSSVFRITAEAAVNDGTRTAVAVVSNKGRTLHYLKVD